jgi:hypothetical protein
MRKPDSSGPPLDRIRIGLFDHILVTVSGNPMQKATKTPRATPEDPGGKASIP